MWCVHVSEVTCHATCDLVTSVTCVGSGWGPMSEPVYTHRSRSQALEWDSPPPPAPGSDSCQLWLGFRGRRLPCLLSPWSRQPCITNWHLLWSKGFLVASKVWNLVFYLCDFPWCWCYSLEFETRLKFYILMTSPVIKVLEVCEFKSSTLGSLTINYEHSQCSDEISAFFWLEMIN